MKKQSLFQYAIIWHPTENQEKEGQKSKVIVAPSNILAVDLQAAGLAAAMEIPAEYKDQLDQIQVAMRPF